MSESFANSLTLQEISQSLPIAPHGPDKLAQEGQSLSQKMGPSKDPVKVV